MTTLPAAAVARWPARPAAGWLGEVALATLIAACLAVSGRPWGPWWAALLAGALLWPLLARLPPWRAAVAAAVALTPVPAIGYEGLRVHDPGAWWAVIAIVAAAYGVIGAAAAALAARAWPASPQAWRPLPWALAWSGLDLLLSHAEPWSLPLPVTIGYALVGGPYVALAAVAGPAGLGLTWVVLGNALAVHRPVLRSAGPNDADRRCVRAWRVAAAVLTVLAFGLQAWAERLPLGEPRTVALVQIPGPVPPPAPDAVAPDPSDAARLAAFAARASTLTADLHVWPEAALGTALLGDPSSLARVARELGAPVLAGAFRRAEDGSWRNAVALGDRHGAEFVVDKRWLVPGYEGWLTSGIGERWPVHAAGWRIAVLICWESLFLDVAVDRVRDGADLVVIVAHDGWAAGTATPWWHARAARLVAWSVGRPVVFASHDGPSMVWGHDGRLLARLAAGAAASRAEVAAPPRWRTPYVALGANGVAAGWWASLLVVAVAAWRDRAAG